MTEKTENTAGTAPTGTAERAAAEHAVGVSDVVDRAAGLSDEVLKSAEAGQRAVLEAVRQFLDTLDEAMPRETIIDAVLDMTDRLVATQYGFLRSVVRSTDRALRNPAEEKN